MDGAGAGGELHVDVAVVGLGLIGSATLRELAAAGASRGAVVAGIGPAEPPVLAEHPGPFASHYDSGRITRHLDARYEWAVLATRAIARYGELEAMSGIDFHRPVGAVLAELDPERIASTITNADRVGSSVRVAGPEAPNPYAPLLAFPTGSTLLAEPGPAGHIDPRRMLAANLVVAGELGATIVREACTSLDRSATGGWRVTTAGGAQVRARTVVLAAGPHADELHPALPPLEVRAESVVLATLDDAEARRLAELPSVLARLPDHPVYGDLYLVPPTTYPDGSTRLKLGATSDPYRPLRTAGEKRAWMRGDAHSLELAGLRALVEDLVPGVRTTAWETKPCLITETPTDLPYLDHVDDGLVLAAGGNGYAAKSANAIGAVAARLALEGRWSDPVLDPAAFAAP
ncbi:MAG: FAD-binding oxidoreductase [Acidimicrobiales bacterium]|nr:FAD-binding oxidoreductase [Acidimicrobiales bacterium]